MNPHPYEKQLRDLVSFWKGVARDERHTEEMKAKQFNRSYISSGKPERWERCAQQLEMVLNGKNPHPDV